MPTPNSPALNHLTALLHTHLCDGDDHTGNPYPRCLATAEVILTDPSVAVETHWGVLWPEVGMDDDNAMVATETFARTRLAHHRRRGWHDSTLVARYAITITTGWTPAPDQEKP